MKRERRDGREGVRAPRQWERESMTTGTRAPVIVGVMQRLADRGAVFRHGIPYLFDAGAWVAALIFAVIIRYDFALKPVSWRPLAVLCAITVLAQLGLGFAFYLYRGRHPFGSFAEVPALLWSVGSVAILTGVPIAVFGEVWHIPRGTVFIAVPIAFTLMGAVRYLKRYLFERSIRPGDGAANALIYGAGHLGSSIIRRMLTDRDSRYSPVGLIDDDPGRRQTWLHGIHVYGTRAQLTEVAKQTKATVLIIAIAHANASLLRDIADAAMGAGLRVLVLPPLESVLEGRSRLRDLRDISIEDLIGRHPVDTNVESIAGYLQVVYLAPAFARLYHTRSIDQLNGIASRAVRQVATLLLIPVAILAIAGLPVVTVLFGSAFAPAAGPLAVLAVGALLVAVVGQVNQLMLLCDLETYALVLNTALVVGWATGGLWVASVGGAMGVAIFSVLVNVVYAVVAAYLLKSARGIRSYLWLQSC